MKKLLIGLLLCISGCATQTPQSVSISWVRQSPEETDRICRQKHGAAAYVIGYYRGCAIFNRDAGICTIWAPDFAIKERELMATLGHEVKHCFDGPWH